MLWCILFCLQPQPKPDEDNLPLEPFSYYIDMEKSGSEETIHEKDEIQELWFRAGPNLTQFLVEPGNTKIHRMMHHVKVSTRNFGSPRWGNTDLNESLHKYTKRC